METPVNEINIAIIPKNSTEEYRVKLTEYHGRCYVDARVYISEWGHDHEPRPTKKGITISPNKLRAVIEALQQAEAVAREEGLIKDETAPVPADDVDTPHDENILAAG